MELLVVIAIIGVLTALLLPAVQHAREAARQVQCRNNMRQLGLALHLFHDAHGVFPASGWTMAGPGNPAGKFVGWRPLILPFIEQKGLRGLYDFDQHWWEGANLRAAGMSLQIFQCPTSPARPSVLAAIAKPPRASMTFPVPLAPTDYEALMGVRPSSIDPLQYNAWNRFSVMHRNSRKSFRDITDGASNTIAIVECAGRPQVYRRRNAAPHLSNDQGISWADSEGPFSLDLASEDGTLEGCTPGLGCRHPMNRRNDNEPYSFHLGGANFLFADGRVQLIQETVDGLTFAALCTAGAGEPVSASAEGLRHRTR